MERMYVFRKNSGNSSEKKKTGGVLDTGKFVIEPMSDYNNEFSFLGSVHHILKNHKIIPSTITPQKFYKDIDVEFLNDLDVDGQYKKIAKKIVVYHQDGDNEPEKVIDGVNIFLAERDCNNEYDFDLIKKSKKTTNDDLAIILVKDGTLYAPLYKVGENGIKDGIFRMNDKIVKELLENVQD